MVALTKKSLSAQYGWFSRGRSHIKPLPAPRVLGAGSGLPPIIAVQNDFKKALLLLVSLCSRDLNKRKFMGIQASSVYLSNVVCGAVGDHSS